MFYSAVSADKLRKCKPTTDIQDFIQFTKISTGRIKKQGSLTSPMKKAHLQFGKTDGYILNKLS